MRSAIYQSADGTTAVWDGERVSTAFVESTVNTVVGKCFSKPPADAPVKTRRAPDRVDYG